MKLTIHNLAKSFSRADETIPLFQGLDLSLSPGEAITILGPSGSGKTTLLRIINGLETPDAGEVLFDEQNIFALPESERRAFRLKHIGFSDQYARMLPQLTALENTLLPALGTSQNLTEYAKDILADFGMAKRLHFFPSQLSGGERQRVALARALLLSPDFLLLDEPTSALDAKRSNSLLALIRKINLEKKTSILLVTHNTRVLDFFPKSIYLDTEDNP